MLNLTPVDMARRLYPLSDERDLEIRILRTKGETFTVMIQEMSTDRDLFTSEGCKNANEAIENALSEMKYDGEYCHSW